jgi:hydroxymethylpyrimidine pyrophosphatase-like HAD family hydrolase
MNVIAVDLDGTLIKDNKALPAVETVNRLFEDPNNFIVVHTARSYNIFHETRELLLKHKVKHHALVMEKMRANIYVDDKGLGYDESTFV